VKRRLARPLYESLPWAYLLVGGLCIGGSYVLREGARSVLAALVGVAAFTAGVVVLLRRRDFRRMRAEYDSSLRLGPGDSP
jgi:hypothetical protein